MQIEAPRLKKSFIKSVESIVGEGGLSVQTLDRINYSRDSNFKSVIQNRYRKIENLPDLIVWPEKVEQVARLVHLCLKGQIPVVPYGAGSGVCGGTVPVCGGMVIDLKKMRRLVKIDQDHLTVTAEAGMMGLHLEGELDRRGFTLGHFPSSILCASLGGYLAARSAGQNSSRYGKIEDMVKNLEVVTGTASIIETRDSTNGDGIDFNQIFLGSEGILGLITQATLRIFPKPPSQLFSSFRFKKLEDGLEAMRRFMQGGLKPSVVRLYDPLDTLLFLSHGKGKKKLPPLLNPLAEAFHDQSLKMVLRWPRLIQQTGRLASQRCLLVVVHEGMQGLVLEEQKMIRRICLDLGGEDGGEEPARRWLAHRYSVSYKSSPLFYSGAFTDTIEVATGWDRLHRLYREMKKAIEPHAVVMAHISHVYSDGASIYFTFIAPLKGLSQSENLYDLIWDQALRACQKVGGVISHHHGIGRLKAKYMLEEWGHGLELLRGLKDFFDPHRIMNPGKLVLLKKVRKEMAA